MTEWRYIEGYGHRYIISDEGEVMSLNYAGTGQPRILQLCGDGSEYRKVHLKRAKNHSRRIAVHRLVALTFIPNPNHFKYVIHINHDKKDNRVSNLMWSKWA